MLGSQRKVSIERLRIGIDQQLVWIEAMPVYWIIGPVHTIAIALACPDCRDSDVPDIPGSPQGNALNFAATLLIAQAMFHVFGTGPGGRELRARLRQRAAHRR